MKRQHEVEKRPLGNQHAIFTEPQGGEIQEHFNHRITVEEIASIDNLRMAVCQVRRNAGKGKGIEGERSGLWAEFARIIGEVQPRYIFVENSPLLTKRGLGRVLGDLSEMGYDAEWCVLGADDIGAPHQRKRMWILAYARLWGRRYNIGGEDGEISIEGDSGKRSCNTNSSLRPSEGAEIMADAEGEQDVGRNGRSMAEKKGGGESCHTPRLRLP